MSLKDLISKMRYVKYGDILLPEDHNTFVDAFKAVDAKFDEIEQRIASLEDYVYNVLAKRVKGIAKALVDPSGKYSDYKTITEALLALDQEGVQAAVVLIVPPDDLATYPKVIEGSPVELQNIRYIYIDGRGMLVEFNTTADYWIKLNASEVKVILKDMILYADKTGPITLFYSPPMTKGEAYIINVPKMLIQSKRVIGTTEYYPWSNLFWSDASTTVFGDVFVVNSKFTRLVGFTVDENDIWFGQIVYAPYGSKRIHIHAYNCVVNVEMGWDVLNNQIAYELEFENLEFHSAIMNGWFTRIDRLIGYASGFFIQPRYTGEIYGPVLFSGYIEFPGGDIAKAILYNPMFYAVNFVPRTHVELVDPIIIGSDIRYTGFVGYDLTIRVTSEAIVRATNLEIGKSTLKIIWDSGDHPELNAIRTKSTIDLSGVPSGVKVLLLSSVVDRSKINDPNGVLFSNGANIDVSTWTVF